jgi:hypothetical protein
MNALRSTLRDNGLCVRYTPAWHLSEPTVPCRFQFQKFPALRFSALLIDGAQEEVRFERVALG